MVLFWKKGYKGTSINDLVKHLGVNRASLYDTFGGKEQLFKSAVSKYLESNKHKTQNFLFEHENVKEGFKNLLSQSIQDCLVTNDKRGCMFVNSVTELLPNNLEFNPVLEANKKQMEEIFTIYAGLNVNTKMETDKEKLMKLVDTALEVI